MCRRFDPKFLNEPIRFEKSVILTPNLLNTFICGIHYFCLCVMISGQRFQVVDKGYT